MELVNDIILSSYSYSFIFTCICLRRVLPKLSLQAFELYDFGRVIQWAEFLTRKVSLSKVLLESKLQN